MSFPDSQMKSTVDFASVKSRLLPIEKTLIVNIICVFFIAVSTSSEGRSNPEVMGVELIRELPHDPTAFTQGIELIDKNTFLESTGQYGESSIRSVDVNTGKIKSISRLPGKFFGEGLTRVGNEIFQLTWREGVVLKWRLSQSGQFNSVAEIPVQHEGWGIAHDRRHLYISDGTSKIRVYEPKDFKFVRDFEVKLMGTKLEKLNELEFINDRLFANVWMSSSIVRIDPLSGLVDGMIDLRPFVPIGLTGDAVANGIAWSPLSNRLYVTGKLWPKILEFRLKKKSKP